VAKLLLIVMMLGALAPQPTNAQERGPAGTVTLSRTDYDRLLDLASRQPAPPDRAPLAAALTRADLRVRVANGTVRATMSVDGEVFQAGTVKVSLISNATLLDARMADRALPLVADGNAHVAVLTGPSTFSATLEWGSAVTTTPGRGSFVLPVPPAGSATATFDMPGEQSDLRVSPGLVVRRTSANGRTLIEATLDPGSATQVWWSARESAPTTPPRDVRMLTDVKTLVTIGDVEVRLLTLVDATIVHGEPTQIDVQIPSGYELAGVTGSSLDHSEQQGNRVLLFISAPARRRHQFLLNLERAGTGGSFKLETALPTVPLAQRETGEIAVEGIGTLEIQSGELQGLRRIDVREVDSALTSAARHSLLSAFRYQRVTSGSATLALNVTRFPDASVLAAIAERAVATTLVTSQGRALTEVTLWIRNRAQPFMKVALPTGASMVSVEVAGSAAKPVEGADGMRVPLLRPGFRPTGQYTVAFVYLHEGSAFAKKGDMQMTLPKMDIPVSVVEWELFVPDRYRVDHFSGSAIAADLVERTTMLSSGERSFLVNGANFSAGYGGGRPANIPLDGVTTGQIIGRVTDNFGGVLPGATVNIKVAGQERTAIADASGVYRVSGLPSGDMTVTGHMNGFTSVQRALAFDQRPRQVDFQLAASGVSESVTVNAEAPVINTSTSEVTQTFALQNNSVNNRTRDDVSRRERDQRAQQAAAPPSENVQNLQRRAAGVLPVRIDVPRAGSSYRFVKPLVIDEETLVSFRYKRR
jgi:Carboxypeptidase regulatory-like domain